MNQYITLKKTKIEQKRAGSWYSWSDKLKVNQQAQPLGCSSIISVTDADMSLKYLQIQWQKKNMKH